MSGVAPLGHPSSFTCKFNAWNPEDGLANKSSIWLSVFPLDNSWISNTWEFLPQYCNYLLLSIYFACSDKLYFPPLFHSMSFPPTFHFFHVFMFYSLSIWQDTVILSPGRTVRTDNGITVNVSRMGVLLEMIPSWLSQLTSLSATLPACTNLRFTSDSVLPCIFPFGGMGEFGANRPSGLTFPPFLFGFVFVSNKTPKRSFCLVIFSWLSCFSPLRLVLKSPNWSCFQL